MIWASNIKICLGTTDIYKREAAKTRASHTTLPGVLIMNDFPSFNLDLLIQPLAVTATFGSAFGGPTGRTRIETAQAVFIQAVTEVHSAENQEPLAVIDLALRGYHLSV